MKKVLVIVPCNQRIQDKLEAKFGKNYEFCFAYGNDECITEVLPNAEVIIGEPDEDQILAAKKLEWLQLTWAGTDKYYKMTNLPPDLKITNASGAFGKIISEYVVGSIIALYRSFPKYWDNKKTKTWERVDSATTIFGKTALVLGNGDIGSNVAHRLKAFDCKVLGIRRQLSEAKMQDFDEVYTMDSLEGLLPQADIVIGCLPNNEGTRNQLNHVRLNLMKQDAVLVNVGRGSLIETEALISVLEAGKLKGVCLDVFDIEPLPDNSPLWNMENVLITPHISGPSFGGNKDVEDTIWDICISNLSKHVERLYLRNT